MKKTKSLFNLFLFCLISVLIASLLFSGCGTEKKTETEEVSLTEMKKPRVEGIKEFHDVLYPVWHSYLPEGDYQSIREAIPEFKKSVEILTEAELPEFYHKVKDDFENKRQNLSLAVAKLESIARTGDDKQLEKAVEDMHTAFERMARVLAPRIKQLEDFHLVLYPLWHQAMPKKNYQAIKAAIPSLESRMDALMSAQLSEKFKDIEPQFNQRCEALKKAVDELADVCRENKDEEIIDKLTQMHDAYLELDEVFE